MTDAHAQTIDAILNEGKAKITGPDGKVRPAYSEAVIVAYKRAAQQAGCEVRLRYKGVDESIFEWGRTMAWMKKNQQSWTRQFGMYSGFIGLPLLDKSFFPYIELTNGSCMLFCLDDGL